MGVEDDRLSGLQDDLILKILSLIGIKDVIKTSVLSSRWRYLWTSVSHLNFSSEDISTMDKFYDFVTHVMSHHNKQALNLSSEDFSTMDKLSDFVTYVLSRRNKQVQLSCVNLHLCVKHAHDVARRIMNHALSLNVQQVSLTCLSNVGFSLSILRSKNLKHLTFTRPFGYGHITLISTPELSSLTTLHLDCITLYEGFLSQCPNLENLTLNCCNMKGSNVLRIFHPRLSNLTLDKGDVFIYAINVVTPQLKSLTISQFSGNYLISAPNLASLLFRGYCPSTFSTDGFHSLEKAHLSLHSIRSSQAPDIISLLEKLHNVKDLSLSMEIIQVLNSSIELISNRPSPFTNLESLKVLPKVYCVLRHKQTRVIMSTEVKNYLLNSSPKATLNEVLLGKQCCYNLF